MPAFTKFAALQSAATGTGNGTAVDVTGVSRVGVQITGITTATVTFEGTVDGTNWVAVGLPAAATGTIASAPTADGVWFGTVAGLRLFRARISAYTSGTITVTAALTDACA
jgi:hypothetical protein